MRMPMETLQDLIEEAKVRTVGWAICIFGIAYFLSHTSKSMWMNIPISILIFSAFRFLSLEVELRWKAQPASRPTYLSHLQKKQLSVKDARLSALPSVPRRKRKIDSPPIEAAIDDFINKILQDFVVDLWYSSITPDKEAPELIRVLLLDVLGEISGRVKEINLVELLTRDMVDLIGNHLDLYRRNQSQIGVEVMGTLSFEERDESLKRHLIASKELHPALMSPECEYKVLQRLVGGVLAIILRPQEAQCPLVRCFSRELLTCLVMQPVMNFANPGYINELIEYLFLTSKDDKNREMHSDKPPGTCTSVHRPTHNNEPALRRNEASNHPRDLVLAITGKTSVNILEQGRAVSSQGNTELVHPRPADWARVLDAATQRRTQVLAPENLENMWTRGRNYKKKAADLVKVEALSASWKTTGVFNSNVLSGNMGKELPTRFPRSVAGTEEKSAIQLHGLGSSSQPSGNIDHFTRDLNREPFNSGEIQFTDELENDAMQHAKSHRDQLKRSSSTSALQDQLYNNATFASEDRETVLSHEFHSEHFKHKENPKSPSGLHYHSEASLQVPKVRCRVIGAFFEKNSSKSFAVYSIAVADSENKIWIVKRRYRNFERLHRHLKDIPNYALHLPPKRFLSSSVDDSFVHQRCILLDKYLQDLLSIPNVAEQHEVWDFFSVSSKNYSFGKSTSVMKTLAVNVDDAMDDIVRQFKGVSDGLRRKVVGSPSSSLPHEVSPPKAERATALPLNDNIDRPSSSYSNLEHSYSSHLEMSHSLSDDEVQDEEASSALLNGWHSDNELNAKGFPPRVVKRTEESGNFISQRDQQSGKFVRVALDKSLATNSLVLSDLLVDQNSVPPEWSPPNVSVPLLNLVDKIFQLNRRGWIRRQVYWISKQILQLMMEDAIDDWLVRQIHWLRQDFVIAEGIRWVQNVLWPNGTFFTKLENSEGKMDVRSDQIPTPTASAGAGIKAQKATSFDLQLEAARRASDVKKMILGGAPTALVSLIGNKQYRRCSKDLYYFLQSTVCMKQLAYGMLELLILSMFPELHHLVQDIHKKHVFSQQFDV
uniref:Sorting nexin-16 n=2 Tax=Anthurium amnicola TaxID=1678845 RepID=A0A1D1XTZ4_9ARAE